MSTDAITIRSAGPADAPAVARVAALDSRPAPAWPVLVAQVGGEIVAAAPLDGGPVVADPFRPTAAIVDLLELRVAQQRTARPPRGTLRSLSPRLRAAPRAA